MYLRYRCQIYYASNALSIENMLSFYRKCMGKCFRFVFSTNKIQAIELFWNNNHNFQNMFKFKPIIYMFNMENNSLRIKSDTFLRSECALYIF